MMGLGTNFFYFTSCAWLEAQISGPLIEDTPVLQKICKFLYFYLFVAGLLSGADDDQDPKECE